MIGAFEVTRRICRDLDNESDVNPTFNGITIKVNEAFLVEAECIEHMAKLAIKHGVRSMTFSVDRAGTVTMLVQGIFNNECSNCHGTEQRLQDDGVCFVCRNPYYEPGEQPIGQPEPIDPELVRAFKYDIQEGANLAFLMKELTQTHARKALATALRELASEL